MEEKNYLTAYVNEPQKVLKFLVELLGFSDHRHEPKTYVGKEGVTIGNHFGNNYLLLAGPVLTGPSSKANEAIIINTDNCLRDYQQFKDAGIKIHQTPRYTARGLELIISDNYGNRYLLLERRQYGEEER